MIDVIMEGKCFAKLPRSYTHHDFFFQPCDAKIPFSLPWLDRVERRIAATVGIGADSGDLQPYLSNLCVDEKFRGKKIGRALVRCVEDIAKTTWGMSRMYLHVDEDNIAALSLYCSEGENHA